MEQNSINILCTRPLNELLIREAAEEGILIEELPFIQTEPIQSIEVQQEIEQAFQQNVTVVFTSMNAVEAVAYYQEEGAPDWDIYCMGTTTRKLVAQHFGEERIVGTADDAASLAELIVEEDVTAEVIFFCGDQRRDELPDILRGHDVDVNEVTVYQTIALTHKIEKTYHGILFFSPSAVESFFKFNVLPAETILFAIGNTTANTIRKFTKNKVLISDAPGKDNLVKKMIEYFAG
ncbi:MAG: uroporphyrinogen-III synthase [Bacteroidota bacterium]|nr:uroporphyrinogen-III synthase [Ferruginibacter sp.]